MSSKILARIAAETAIPQLTSALSEELSPSDLQSLLLHVYQVRTTALREADVMRKAGSPLVTPSKINARLLGEFDRVAFEVADGFEAIELSPVCPLGLERVLGQIDQNSILTTIRSAEVLGDSTPAMALECARRRKSPADRVQGAVVRLCSSQRVVRLQPFDIPGYVPHFRLFGLVSAGRDMGSNAFEVGELRLHIRSYLALFRELNAHGFSFNEPRVEISDTEVIEGLLATAGIASEELRHSIRAHRPGGSERFLAERGVQLPDAIEQPTGYRLTRVKTEVFEALRPEFPEAQFRFNLARLEGLGYYRGICLRISPAASDGARFPIVDGGFTDWTARLLEDRKERFLATGIGSEFACFRYRA